MRKNITISGLAPALASPAALRQISAGALALSALVHLWLAPAHLGESLILGLGFVGMGLAQLLFGVLLLARPSSWLLPVALSATVASLALYVVAHTSGLPFHDHGGAPIGALDGVCKGAELLALYALGRLLYQRHGLRPVVELALVGLLAALTLLSAGGHAPATAADSAAPGAPAAAPAHDDGHAHGDSHGHNPGHEHP